MRSFFIFSLPNPANLALDHRISSFKLLRLGQLLPPGPHFARIQLVLFVVPEHEPVHDKLPADRRKVLVILPDELVDFLLRIHAPEGRPELRHVLARYLGSALPPGSARHHFRRDASAVPGVQTSAVAGRRSDHGRSDYPRYPSDVSSPRRFHPFRTGGRARAADGFAAADKLAQIRFRHALASISAGRNAADSAAHSVDSLRAYAQLLSGRAT